ncbi:hypothetical protein AB0929_17650 [Streptomyces massasporeus]|uniref:hypothetical protein n=1 Tax=Streptomyces massasporeus TaxID=67324 RepID=UPI003456BC86
MPMTATAGPPASGVPDPARLVLAVVFALVFAVPAAPDVLLVVFELALLLLVVAVRPAPSFSRAAPSLS